MADQNDHETEELLGRCENLYAAFVAICKLLPIRIGLPTGSVTLNECIDGVARVAELAIDQPMPEEMQAALMQMCLHWLNAMDIAALYTANPREYRLHGAQLSVVEAETLAGLLMTWIIDETEPDQE